MNRHRLVSLISNLLIVRPTPAQPSGPAPLLADAAGRAFVASPRSSSRVAGLTALVHAYANGQAALLAARHLLDDAGRIEATGALSVQDRREWLLPAGFAPIGGGLVSWRTLSGASTPETAWVTGVFYRNTLVWEISVNGAGRSRLIDLVLDLGRDLAARPHRGLPKDELWSLLPDAEDLPMPMWLDATYSRPQADDLDTLIAA